MRGVEGRSSDIRGGEGVGEKLTFLLLRLVGLHSSVCGTAVVVAIDDWVFAVRFRHLAVASSVRGQLKEDK